jgi:polysaccharide biosynthesis protein PslG
MDVSAPWGTAKRAVVLGAALAAVAAAVLAPHDTAAASRPQAAKPSSSSATTGISSAHHRHHAKPISYAVSPTLFGMHDTSRISLTKPGVHAIRLWDTHTAWSDIETSPGVYTWTNLDHYVTAAQKAGVKVTLVLGLTPSFYSSDPTKLPADEVQHYASYVKAVMDRYRHWGPSGAPGIQSYQVWNEANISGYWTGTQQEMGDLTKIVWDLRNSDAPGATVVAPALTTRMSYQVGWIKKWAAVKIGPRKKPVYDFFDVTSLNLYPPATIGTGAAARPGLPEDSMTQLAAVKAILRAAHWPAKPIWDTEINYGLVGGELHPPAAPISDSHQVAFVIRTYLLNAARGVKRVFWYRYDLGPYEGGTLANTLMTKSTDFHTLTPAGHALTRVESWLNGARLVGTPTNQPCTTDSHGTYTCLIRYASGVGRVYWNPFRTATVTLSRTATKTMDGSGRTASVHGGQKLRVRSMPVLVRSRS